MTPGCNLICLLTNSIAEEKGQNNLAFACRLQLGEADACVDLLVKTDRAPEAAFFARTYAPRLVNDRYSMHIDTDLCRLDLSQVPKAVDAWRAGLATKSRKKIAAAVASPVDNSELFPEGWDSALERESDLKSQANTLLNGHTGKSSFLLPFDRVLTNEHV